MAKSQNRVPPTHATRPPKPKPKQVAQIQMMLILVDEYNALQQVGIDPFIGGPDGTPVDKAVAFLTAGGIQNMLNTVPPPQEIPPN